MYNADSLLSDLHSVTPGTSPGTKFKYNSTAMKLLELLLEQVYHEPYELLVQNYLHTHLKMYDTKPYLKKAEIRNSVQGFNNNRTPQPFLNLTGYYFRPTMNSTINDMLKYIAANLSNAEKDLQLTHQITYGSETGFAIGLGWMMDNNNKGKRYIYHDGNTKIGFNTLCIFYPEDSLGFIIIANDTVSQENPGHIENNIQKILNE